tara:strand:- start:247 stop:483 length:237 start_codon:yes stop_codon:yes gene_type:complete
VSKHPNQIRRDREKQPSFNINLVEEDIRLIYNAVDFYLKNRSKSAERPQHMQESTAHLKWMKQTMMTMMMESSFQKNK